MGTDKDEKEQLKDIPSHPEEDEKAKKIKAAPDEVLAKAIHEWIMKDHPE